MAGGRRPATMLMILAVDGGRGRYWTEPEAQGGSVPGMRGAPRYYPECRQAVAARVVARRSSGRARDSVREEPAAEESMVDRKPLGDAELAPRGPVALPGGRISLIASALGR